VVVLSTALQRMRRTATAHLDFGLDGDSSLLHPGKPPVRQQEHMVGLDLFSGLAHESKKVGHRFEDSHARDLAIARSHGRRAGVGRLVQNLKRTNEAFFVGGE
jgi:hypothetical protein